MQHYLMINFHGFTTMTSKHAHAVLDCDLQGRKIHFGWSVSTTDREESLVKLACVPFHCTVPIFPVFFSITKNQKNQQEKGKRTNIQKKKTIESKKKIETKSTPKKPGPWTLKVALRPAGSYPHSSIFSGIMKHS